MSSHLRFQIINYFCLLFICVFICILNHLVNPVSDNFTKIYMKNISWLHYLLWIEYNSLIIGSWYIFIWNKHLRSFYNSLSIIIGSFKINHSMKFVKSCINFTTPCGKSRSCLIEVSNTLCVWKESSTKMIFRPPTYIIECVSGDINTLCILFPLTKIFW